MPTAQVNGQRLYFEDSGGDGPPVVFSHGFLMDTEMWHHQVDSLGSDFRCVTWDERGFGRTEYDGQPFTYYDTAADLVGLLDHLGIDSAVWVGMSQGGYLSLRGALTYPERVAALVLIDTQAEADSPEAASGYQAMFEVWKSQGGAAVAPGVASALVSSPELEPAWLEKWYAKGDDYLTPAACMLQRDDVVERLGEIAVPTLVIHGELDQAIPVSAAETLCERLPDCRGLVVVPGAGHASNLTHPEVVTPALREFLTSL